MIKKRKGRQFFCLKFRLALCSVKGLIMYGRNRFCSLHGFLPTARSAVGLGITYSHFYSFYHHNLAILPFCHLDILTGLTILDTTWRYSTLLDASQRFSTLLDATQRFSTLLDAARRCLTELDAARRCSTLLDAARRYSKLLDATRRYSTLFDAARRCTTLLDAARRCSTLLDTT
jgi:hypothetical protein